MLFNGQCPKCGGLAVNVGGVVSCSLCGDTAEVTDIQKLKEMCRDDRRFGEAQDAIRRAERDDDLTFTEAPVTCSFPEDIMVKLPAPGTEDFTSFVVHSLAFFLGYLEHFEDLPEIDVFTGGQSVELTFLRSQARAMSTLSQFFETPFEDLVVLSVSLYLRHQKQNSKSRSSSKS